MIDWSVDEIDAEDETAGLEIASDVVNFIEADSDVRRAKDDLVRVIKNKYALAIADGKKHVKRFSKRALDEGMSELIENTDQDDVSTVMAYFRDGTL